MATFTQLPPNPSRARSKSRLRSKTILWISLGLTTLFVFITSEVLLFTDYPMYHAYRLQVIADRSSSSRIRSSPSWLSSSGRSSLITISPASPQNPSRPRPHLRDLCIRRRGNRGRPRRGRPGFPGTSMQAAAWVVCTTAALITARNRQIIQHRQWMARSTPSPSPSSPAVC